MHRSILLHAFVLHLVAIYTVFISLYARADTYKPSAQALKMFLHVFKHFEDFQEDQFDFHTYCLRKMTLRAYVEMLRMEDELYHHIYYSKAAWGAVETYLLLLDQPDKNAQVRREDKNRTDKKIPHLPQHTEELSTMPGCPDLGEKVQNGDAPARNGLAGTDASLCACYTAHLGVDRCKHVRMLRTMPWCSQMIIDKTLSDVTADADVLLLLGA